MNKFITPLLFVFLLLSFSATAQNLVFAKKAGGNSPGNGETANSIVVENPSGISYVTGHIIAGTSGAIFGSGEPNQTTVNNNGFFLAKYDSNGLLIWVKGVGFTGNYSDGKAVELDDEGNIYVTGQFFNSMILDPGGANETTISGSLGTSFLAKYSPDGDLIWVESFGGEFDEAGGFGLAYSAPNEIIVTGNFSGNTTFGQGQTSAITIPAISTDVYIAKYNTAGTFLWAKKAGGNGDDIGKNLAVDSNRNIYLTGNYIDDAVFGLGEPNEITLQGANETAYIAKFSPEGNLTWAMNPYVATSADISGDIGVLSDDSIVFTGAFFGSIELGANTANSQILTGNGGDEILLANFDSDGNFIWARYASSPANDRGVTLAVDLSSSIFITGYYGEDITFGSGEPKERTLINQGNSDFYIAKYASNGDFQWASAAGGSAWQQGTDIAIKRNGRIVTTGFYFGAVTFGNGEINETFLPLEGQSDFFMSEFSDLVTVLESNFAFGLNYPLGLDLKNGELYVTESTGNSIVKFNTNDPVPVAESVLTGLNAPTAVLVVENTLYFTESDGKLSKADLTQSNPSPELVIDNLQEPRGLAIHGNELFISEAMGDKIVKIDITSNSPVAEDVVTGILNPTGISIQQDDLFIAAQDEDKVYQVDLSQSNPTAVDLGISNLSNPLQVFVKDDLLYVTSNESSTSKLSRINLNTLASEEILENNIDELYGLFVTDDLIFVSEPTMGTIARVNLNVLSTEEASFENFEGTSVYPNPTKNRITIKGMQNEQSRYRLVNLLGATVKQGSIERNNPVLNISEVNTGMYYLILDDQKAIKVLKAE